MTYPRDPRVTVVVLSIRAIEIRPDFQPRILMNAAGWRGFYLKFSFPGVSLPRVLLFITVCPPLIECKWAGASVRQKLLF